MTARMLTWAERLTLWNEYEILKRLDPTNSELYDENQEIVANGYEIFYEELTQSVYPTTLSTAAAREVMEILDLFRVIEFSAREGGFDPKSHAAQFQGFDGNNECDHYGFAKFLRRKQGKWQELKDRPDNSHAPLLDKYRRMVEAWKRLGRGGSLTASQIDEITEA